MHTWALKGQIWREVWFSSTTWRAITYLCPADSLIECCRPLDLWQGAQNCASFNALTAC